MSRGIIGRALAGAGAATEAVGFEATKAALLAMRDERLNEFQNQRDEKGREHQTSERVAGEGFQRKMEVDVKQPHQVAMQNSGFDHAREIQRNDIDSRETLQENQFEFTGNENDKNRALEQKRIGLEGARLGLAQQQFNLAKEQAGIAMEAGKLDLEQKKRLDGVYKEAQAAKTPEEMERATAKLYTFLGKDRFIVSKTKDADGAEQTTVLNAHTGRPVDGTSRGAMIVDRFKNPGAARTTAAPSPASIETRGTPLASEPPGTPTGDAHTDHWRERVAKEQERLDQRAARLRNPDYDNTGY